VGVGSDDRVIRPWLAGSQPGGNVTELCPLHPTSTNPATIKTNNLRIAQLDLSSGVGSFFKRITRTLSSSGDVKGRVKALGRETFWRSRTRIGRLS
jgi:hypothetical protein